MWRWHRTLYCHLLDLLTSHFIRTNTTGPRACPTLHPTCGAEGDEGLDMFAYKCQLILGQRQPPYNVLDEVVRCYCCQVPLQLPQHHQFPFLKRARQRETDRESSEQREITKNETELERWNDTKYHPIFAYIFNIYTTAWSEWACLCGPLAPYIICVEVKHDCYYVSLCLAEPGTEKHQQRHQPRWPHNTVSLPVCLSGIWGLS